MKVVVDLTRCQGYPQCAVAAPDVSAMRGDKALLDDPDPDDAEREKIARPAAAARSGPASSTGRTPGGIGSDYQYLALEHRGGHPGGTPALGLVTKDRETTSKTLSWRLDAEYVAGEDFPGGAADTS